MFVEQSRVCDVNLGLQFELTNQIQASIEPRYQSLSYINLKTLFTILNQSNHQEYSIQGLHILPLLRTPFCRILQP